MGEECTVSLGLFAGPGQILRRFSVFAEEPHKSIITTTEPFNPVFKEAQPRPSRTFIQLSSQSNLSSLVINVFGRKLLLVL